MDLATATSDDSLVESIAGRQTAQQENTDNAAVIPSGTKMKEDLVGQVNTLSANSWYKMISDLQSQAWLEAQEDSQPFAPQRPPLVELVRRVILTQSGVKGFPGLDVWSYGKPIRDGEGEDRLKLAKLWEEICGRDTMPLIQYGYFTLPVFPEMLNFLSEKEISRAQRFINPTLRISMLGEYFLVLTVRDGAVWNEFTLETFLRAWELMVGWYRQALEDLSRSGRVARSLDDSFSSNHGRLTSVTESNEQLVEAHRLLDLLIAER